jgi:hypothetical protein
MVFFTLINVQNCAIKLDSLHFRHEGGSVMEDLWRLQNRQYQLADWADRAEYARLLKRFRQEEEQSNRAQLLFAGELLTRSKSA